MSDYCEKLGNTTCKNVTDIINWCHELLPKQWKSCPWKHPELIHGIGLLASEEALNCYMSAYGEMHVGKCRAAIMNFPFDKLSGAIEIVDWGCGQGIGSITLIEALQQHDLLKWVKKISLVEPSKDALQRAVCNISKIVNNSIEIDAINKFMPSIEDVPGETLTSIGYRYSNVIHVFSNILDVRAIDLITVARMVASSHGNHFILCDGPKNGAAFRIEQFCSIFGQQDYFSRIDSVCYGHTQRTGHPFTCMTRCFSYNGLPLDISKMTAAHNTEFEDYNDYDVRLQVQNGVFSAQKGKVAYRLQNILSVDDIIYTNPVINEVGVDFVIVRPNKGVLLINLFEQNLNDCSLSPDKKEIIINHNDGEKITYQSPIDLISLCQTSIKDGIEELLMRTIECSKNYGLVKKVVIFTENNLEEVKSFFNVSGDCINYTFIFGSDFISNQEVSLNLYRKIGFIYNSPSFDDAVIRKLSQIISPSWHSYQEGKIGIEPKGAQRDLVISKSTQQKISGVAGSGKTHVLAARAINAMKRTGGDVLVLTYNITLANYIKSRLSDLREDFSWGKIDIYPYHQFFKICASQCHLHVKIDSYEDLSFFEETPKHKYYSAIFVDEVQDYKTEWLKILMNNFLEPNGEFVVFGDPKQNLYHRPIDKQGDIRLGVIGGEWKKALTTGRRFTNPKLATIATAFQANFLSETGVNIVDSQTNHDNSINFQIVSYYDMRSNFSIEHLVSQVVDIISNNDAKEFVLLASSSKILREIDFSYRNITKKETEVTFVSKEQDEELKRIHGIIDDDTNNWKYERDYNAIGRARKQLFTTDKRCLKLATIKSFKGWESPAVICILEDEYNMGARSQMEPELVYTAITRARDSLYILNIGNYSYDEFFIKQST